jgi:pimeloyl-ACP methyl ester carboxylesterase
MTVDQLRCIVRPAENARGRPPLLFVHGAFIGAWCWDEHFLGYFAERGYDAWAVDLRGHGEGETTDDFASVDDYVADVLLAVERMGAAPVLIGHSMGAIVVQRAMRRAAARAVALLAPVPPQGLFGSSFMLAANNPEIFNEINKMQFLDGIPGSPALLRQAIFSPQLPAEAVNRYLRRMRHESRRALFDLSWPQHFWINRTAAPLKVIGAADDLFFPPPLVEAAAALHDAKAEIVPDVAHALMLDARWEAVAKRLHDWLERSVR